MPLSRLILFVVVGLSYPLRIHAQNLSDEAYAYATYVRCFNLGLMIVEKGWHAELDREAAWSCTDFAIASLERSTKPSATRYLAYLRLLNTDGDGTQRLGSALHRRENSSRYLREAAAFLEHQGDCVLAEVVLSVRANGLCRAR